MKYMLIILLVLMIVNVHANCEEGQIDINSALLEDLMDITQIGESRANQIISLRPFESIDDLVRVGGIAEKRLETIKAEGLACVENEEGPQEEIEELVEEETENSETINTTGVPLKGHEKEEINIKNTELEVIKLNTQIIKSEDTLKGTSNKENLDNEKILGKANYPMYGFVIFCFLLGFLFIIKKNRFNKNEFG